MNRKIFAAVFAAVTLVISAPIFARDWDGADWARRDRAQAYEIARDRAELRHDRYLQERYGVPNRREIAHDRAALHHDLRETWH